MCGRFENKLMDDDFLDLFKNSNLKVECDKEINERAKEDIRPTQKILSILLKENLYRITRANWGIKFSADSPLIFNSRIETIKEKKFWTTLFIKNRCVVPMSGFYEWKTAGKKKTKYKIFLPGEKIFFVPALFAKDKEENISVSLITTTPNELIKTIHHRMPVILDFKKAIKFLNNETEENYELCIPFDDKKRMEMEEV